MDRFQKMLMQNICYYRVLPFVIVITAYFVAKVSSFSPNPTYLSTSTNIVLSASSSATSSMPTLTEDTVWNLRMALNNLPTEKGKKTDRIFSIQAKFIEEIGYEPPQGIIQQIFSISEDIGLTTEENVIDGDSETQTRTTKVGAETSATTTAFTTQMKIRSGRWSLSEDPNDRKDSLWIWGLFKEPLYPFLLLQFEIDSICLPGEEKDSIKPFQLYAQINHKRGDNGEVILSLVSDINIRQKETMKADPFGAATIDIYEDTPVGQIQLQPMTQH